MVLNWLSLVRICIDVRNQVLTGAPIVNAIILVEQPILLLLCLLGPLCLKVAWGPRPLRTIVLGVLIRQIAKRRGQFCEARVYILFIKDRIRSVVLVSLHGVIGFISAGDFVDVAF